MNYVYLLIFINYIYQSLRLSINIISIFVQIRENKFIQLKIIARRSSEIATELMHDSRYQIKIQIIIKFIDKKQNYDINFFTHLFNCSWRKFNCFTQNRIFQKQIFKRSRTCLSSFRKHLCHKYFMKFFVMARRTRLPKCECTYLLLMRAVSSRRIHASSKMNGYVFVQIKYKRRMILTISFRTNL